MKLVRGELLSICGGEAGYPNLRREAIMFIRMPNELYLSLPFSHKAGAKHDEQKSRKQLCILNKSTPKSRDC